MFVSKIVTRDKYFQKHMVIDQGSVISDWVWVKKGSLLFSKRCATTPAIVTKLISDQLPSFLTREEVDSRAFWRITRGTPEEQTKAVPILSVSPSTALVVTGQRSAGNCALPSVCSLWS